MPKAPAGLYPGGKERVLRGQNPAQSRPASGRYFLGAAVVGLWGGPTSIHLPLATLATEAWVARSATCKDHLGAG